MANENRPLVEVKPGDPITAGRFNGMQKSLRQEHIQHAHTGVWKDGLFDGAPIGTDGLADGAVTGAKIAATAALSVRSLAAESAALTGSLKVDRDATIGGVLKVSGEATLAGTLRVSGEATLAGLKVEGGSKIVGALGVEGEATLAALRVSGTSTLENVVLGSLAASGGISTSMLGVSGDLNYQGKLGKLDVAESGAAILRCFDLQLGHSTRRGAPGRALVDSTTELVINYGGDWNLVNVASALLVQGRHTVVSEGTRVRVVWGIVADNGNIIAGSGFKARRERDFTWITIDNPAFTGVPCVIVQQLGSGNTKDNALVDDLESYLNVDKPDFYHSFSVMTGNGDGNRDWRRFAFIAIGPI